MASLSSDSSPPSSETPDSPLLIYLAGDRSGVGKSTVCLGILGCLLKLGYKAQELAYIKPCTQCEDVQLVSKFCERNNIDHMPKSPIRFYQGFTYECIDELDPAAGAERRRQTIKQAVTQISRGKRVVLVDGVGYAAVGSIAGISNAQVASLLGAPVVIVGRPGVGDAIDSLNLGIAYFQQHAASVIGVIFNNIPETATYHSFSDCQTYVTKYLTRFSTVKPLGFIPRNAELYRYYEEHKAQEICILRLPRGDPMLQMTDEEARLVDLIVEATAKHVNVSELLQLVGAARI